MNRLFFNASLFLILSGICTHGLAQQSASPRLTDRTPKGIVSYFNRLIKDSLLVVGQHCTGEDNDPMKGYQTFFENLHTQTGQYPGLLGLEYGYKANVDHDLINKLLIDHWNKGGLVCVSWHADNPFKAGYNVSWNAIEHKDSIDLKRLLALAPESTEKISYRNELMRVAAGLTKLKEAGVTVLWRPFHEMNGSWFWWGVNDSKQPTNTADFQLLWQDMHQTFSRLGLDNLVWVYSVNNPWNQWVRESIHSMYPGDTHVDLVGMDIYKAPVPEFTDNYTTLKKFNKTIIIAECGDDIDNQGVKVLNEPDLIRIYRGKAAYFMQWSSWYNRKLNGSAGPVKVRRAIIDNPNANEMMNDPSVITLSKLK